MRVIDKLDNGHVVIAWNPLGEDEERKARKNRERLYQKDPQYTFSNNKELENIPHKRGRGRKFR